MSQEAVSIKALTIYPVKSCSGIQTQKINLTPRGASLRVGQQLIGDREWMFVSSEGQFLTQRTLPQLSLIRPEIKHESLYLCFNGNEIEIPLEAPLIGRRAVDVWSATVDCAIVDVQGIDLLAEFLGQKVQLVRFDQVAKRSANRGGESLGVETRFTDSQPYLVVNQASLQDLNSRMPSPVAMSRFRANIEVSGSAAFAEDRWQTLRASGVEFISSKPCSRCVMVNIDQENRTELVRRDSEVLKTLGQFRRQEKGIYFGQYFFSRSFGAEISLGDSLTAQMA